MDDKTRQEVLQEIEKAKQAGDTALNLSSNQLTNVSEGIEELKNLTKLNLRDNRLTSIPKWVKKMGNLKELNLGGNQLTRVPEGIRELKNLTALSLYNNQLTHVPECIGELKNLSVLRLYNNQLTSVPGGIRELKNLTRLDLSKNQLTSVPEWIRELKNLTILDLSDNQLTSVPEWIRELKNLTELGLSGNQLTSVPEWIREMKNLTELSLHNNQLTSIPEGIKELTNLTGLNLSKNSIRELPESILELNLQIAYYTWSWRGTLALGDNPLEVPPVEIVKQGNEAIRNYFQSLKKDKKQVPLYEAKLLIVGQGDVGKTFLKYRLIHNSTPNGKTTEGIEIESCRVPTADNKKIRVNFWDFGGQEIYHATHQFFLTKRSFYLFVWEARIDDDLTSFDYWLNVIGLLSDKSPVLMVMNKLDERTKAIDERSIQNKFPNVLEFYKVSAKDGTNCGSLRKRICEEIAKLPQIGDLLPGVWVEIRKKLENLGKNYISFDEYKQICQGFNQDEKQAEFLSDYFHDLGVFLCFRDNPILRNIIFLRPDWATNAVYKVLDTRPIQDNHGRFQFDQLHQIWKDYPPDKYATLIELMKKFELCFQIENSQQYIVPELLPAKRPEFNWDNSDNLCFEYRYGFMPAGIMTRFIARMHHRLKGQLFWRHGAVLSWDNTEAMIVGDRLQRRIQIRIHGQKPKDMLAVVREQIDYIHKTLNNPQVNEMILCNCSTCQSIESPYYHDYKNLISAKLKRKRTTECKESHDDIPIDELLGEYGLMEDIDKMIKERRNITYIEKQYNVRGDSMEIHNQNIYGKYAKVFNADQIQYIEKQGHSIDDFFKSYQAIRALEKKEREEIEKKFHELEQEKTETRRDSLIGEIKSYARERALGILDSLSASLIFFYIQNYWRFPQ